jgi:hypothetical protein
MLIVAFFFAGSTLSVVAHRQAHREKLLRPFRAYFRSDTLISQGFATVLTYFALSGLNIIFALKGRNTLAMGEAIAKKKTQ